MKEQPTFFPIYKRDRKTELGIFLFYLLLTILLRFEILPQFTTAYLGGYSGDGGLYIWLTKHTPAELFQNGWFNTEAFFPYSRTLAWSDNFILPTLIVQTLMGIGLSHIASYNLVLLVATILNGFCTYRAAYALSGQIFGAILCGVIFSHLGYLTYAIGHPQLQFIFFLPLGIQALFLSLTEKQRSSAFLFGLLVLMAFLTTVYYALFLVVIAACFWGTLFLIRREEVTLSTLLQFGLFSALGVSPLLFFVFPYLDIQEVFGKRGIYEAYYFAASTFSYFSSAPSQFLYGGTSSLTHGEAHLFPGIAVYVLSGISLLHLIWSRYTRKRAVASLGIFALLLFFARYRSYQYFTTVAAWGLLLFFLNLIWKISSLEKKIRVRYLSNRSILTILFTTALIFFLVSLGPLGNPEKKEYALGLYRIFYEFVPGFSSMRAISRSGIVVLLMLCLTIPFASMKFREKKHYLFLLLGIAGIAFLENGIRYYPIEPPKEMPAILEAQDYEEDAVIVFLPLTEKVKGDGTVASWSDFAARNVTTMNWAHDLGLKTMNGYSGQRSKIMKEFPRKLDSFPDKRSIGALSFIPSLRYIYTEQGIAIKPRLKNFPELQVLNEDPEGRMLLTFSPKTKLSDTFYLRAPSSPAGTLTLTFQTLYQPEETTYNITLHEKDHYEDREIGKYSLLANGTDQSFSLTLPETQQRARPFRIFFKTDTKKAIYLKERAWKPFNSANQE